MHSLTTQRLRLNLYALGVALLFLLSGVAGFFAPSRDAVSNARSSALAGTTCYELPNSLGVGTYNCPPAGACTYAVTRRWLWSDLDTYTGCELPVDPDGRFLRVLIWLCDNTSVASGTLTPILNGIPQTAIQFVHYYHIDYGGDVYLAVSDCSDDPPGL